MPARPDQTDPQQAAVWAQRRRDVGAEIRRLRIEKGLTQEALALRSGVTRNMLIDVELGRRSLLFERLYDLALALDVPASALLPNEPRDSH